MADILLDSGIFDVMSNRWFQRLHLVSKKSSIRTLGLHNKIVLNDILRYTRQDNPTKTKFIKQLGDLIKAKGSKNEIESVIKEIEKYLETINDIHIKSILLFYMALGYFSISNFDESIKRNEIILKILKSSSFNFPKFSNLKLLIGCHIIIGNSYFSMKNFSDAKKHFTFSQSLFKSKDFLVNESPEICHVNKFMLSLCEVEISSRSGDLKAALDQLQKLTEKNVQQSVDATIYITALEILNQIVNFQKTHISTTEGYGPMMLTLMKKLSEIIETAIPNFYANENYRTAKAKIYGRVGKFDNDLEQYELVIRSYKDADLVAYFHSMVDLIGYYESEHKYKLAHDKMVESFDICKSIFTKEDQDEIFKKIKSLKLQCEAQQFLINGKSEDAVASLKSMVMNGSEEEIFQVLLEILHFMEKHFLKESDRSTVCELLNQIIDMLIVVNKSRSQVNEIVSHCFTMVLHIFDRWQELKSALVYFKSCYEDESHHNKEEIMKCIISYLLTKGCFEFKIENLHQMKEFFKSALDIATRLTGSNACYVLWKCQFLCYIAEAIEYEIKEGYAITQYAKFVTNIGVDFWSFFKQVVSVIHPLCTFMKKRSDFAFHITSTKIMPLFETMMSHARNDIENEPIQNKETFLWSMFEITFCYNRLRIFCKNFFEHVERALKLVEEYFPEKVDNFRETIYCNLGIAYYRRRDHLNVIYCFKAVRKSRNSPNYKGNIKENMEDLGIHMSGNKIYSTVRYFSMYIDKHDKITNKYQKETFKMIKNIAKTHTKLKNKSQQFDGIEEVIYYLYNLAKEDVKDNVEQLDYSQKNVVPEMMGFFISLANIKLDDKFEVDRRWYLTKAWDRLTQSCMRLKLEKPDKKSFPSFATTDACRSIKIKNQNITDEWITSIRRKLEMCVIVKTIVLQGCTFSNKAFLCLLQILKKYFKDKKIPYFEISENETFGEFHAKELAKFIQAVHVEVLDVHGCNFNRYVMEIFAPASENMSISFRSSIIFDTNEVKCLVTPQGVTEKFGFSGCSISIPPGAVQTDTEMRFMIDPHLVKLPDHMIQVTPIVQCLPSGLKLLKLATIKLSTWCRPLKGSPELTIFTREQKENDWLTESHVTHASGSFIEFKTKHFCEKLLGASKDANNSYSFQVMVYRKTFTMFGDYSRVNILCIPKNSDILLSEMDNQVDCDFEIGLIVFDINLRPHQSIKITLFSQRCTIANASNSILCSEIVNPIFQQSRLSLNASNEENIQDIDVNLKIKIDEVTYKEDVFKVFWTSREEMEKYDAIRRVQIIANSRLTLNISAKNIKQVTVSEIIDVGTETSVRNGHSSHAEEFNEIETNCPQREVTEPNTVCSQKIIQETKLSRQEQHYENINTIPKTTYEENNTPRNESYAAESNEQENTVPKSIHPHPHQQRETEIIRNINHQEEITVTETVFMNQDETGEHDNEYNEVDDAQSNTLEEEPYEDERSHQENANRDIFSSSNITGFSLESSEEEKNKQQHKDTQVTSNESRRDPSKNLRVRTRSTTESPEIKRSRQ